MVKLGGNKSPDKKKMSPESPLASPSSGAAIGGDKSPKPKPPKPTLHTVGGSLDVIVPASLGNATGDCAVLVQIDPDDAAALDFEGTTGAIGRFQVDDRGILLDLKGSQYRGTILPGPTVLVASLHYSAQHQQELRLESITDEFCPLVKTQDVMAKLDGHIEGTLDESYQLQEEDVNIIEKRKEQQLEQSKKQKSKKQKTKATPDETTSKRKPSSSSAKSKTSLGSSNKKVKVTMGRKK